MKYFSLTFMILSVLTGIYSISSTLARPFTESMVCDFYDTEYVYLDQTFTTSASAYPINSVDSDLTWTCSDNNIAKISDVTQTSYGASKVTITPISEGLVTITATANENISSSFELQVKSRPVLTVSLATDCPYTTILTGSSYSCTATIEPNNATYKTLTWTSSNDNIISVDQEGNFRAISEGTATITATAHNGIYDSKTFVVKDNIYIESINITDTSYSLTLYRYNSRQLSYTYTPANANVLDVTWTTADETIVEVDQNGKIHAPGPFGDSIKITVKTSNGITDYIYVTVPEVHATSITITGAEGINAILDIGDTLQLSCTKQPSNVTDPVTWSSSNSEIISVSQYGKVTAHAETTTGVIITATCGTKTATVIIYCIDKS